MQKEIKKRAQIYGIAAILLATVLGAIFLLNIPGYQTPTPSSSMLKPFTSRARFRRFTIPSVATQLF